MRHPWATAICALAIRRLEPGIRLRDTKQNDSARLDIEHFEGFFFTIDANNIRSYNYITSAKFLNGPSFDSPIIHAIKHPSTNNAIIALESGEAIGQNILNRTLILKSLHTWMRIRVASKPFLLACHEDSISMACLDTAGILTVRNLNNPEVVIQQQKINFKSDNVKLLNFFIKATPTKF